MRIADAIFETLKSEVDTVFYLPGGGCAPLVDALGQSGLKAVCCLHEQGAGFAAVGYAQHKGFGVCLVTSGPGATNAVTPCLAAWTDSVPVLFISGQAKTEMLKHNTRAKGLQYVDAVRMAKPITKQAYEPLTSTIDAMMALEDMITKCKTGRKAPCWLSVPQDLQAVEYE
jgi:acetolactate synthase-1/2/3 large subunit